MGDFNKQMEKAVKGLRGEKLFSDSIYSYPQKVIRWSFIVIGGSFNCYSMVIQLFFTINDNKMTRNDND